MKITPTAIKQGSYLKTLTYREYLGLLIEQNGIYWSKQGDNERAIYYLQTALKLNPRNADGVKSLGLSYKFLSQKSSSNKAEIYQQKANALYLQSLRMGVTRLARTDYLEEQQKAQQAYRKQKQ